MQTDCESLGLFGQDVDEKQNYRSSSTIMQLSLKFSFGNGSYVY